MTNSSTGIDSQHSLDWSVWDRRLLVKIKQYLEIALVDLQENLLPPVDRNLHAALVVTEVVDTPHMDLANHLAQTIVQIRELVKADREEETKQQLVEIIDQMNQLLQLTGASLPTG